MKRTNHSRTYKPRSLRVLEQRSRKQIIWTVIFSLVLLYFGLFKGLPLLIGGISGLNKPAASQAKLSQEATLAPPILNIPFEATNSAEINISGFSTPDAMVEIYLDDNLVKQTPTNSDGSFIVTGIPLNLGSNSIYGKSKDGNNQVSLPSKPINITFTNEKPKLEISEPEDNKQIKGGDKKVTISGQTDPDNNLNINGTIVILQTDGHFAVVRDLNEGDNNFIISATNQVGNTTTVERKVNYQN